jgi:aminopeptidase
VVGSLLRITFAPRTTAQTRSLRLVACSALPDRAVGARFVTTLPSRSKSKTEDTNETATTSASAVQTVAKRRKKSSKPNEGNSEVLLKSNTSATLREDLDGVVVGIYENGRLTPIASELDKLVKKEISKRVEHSKKMKKGDVGSAVVLLNVSEKFPRIALVGLGTDPHSFKPSPAQEADKEQYPKFRDAIRQAAGTGVRLLREHGAKRIGVESFNSHVTDINHSQTAGEGALLGLYKYDELLSVDKREAAVEVFPFGHTPSEAAHWYAGLTIAKAQNFVRKLTEAPANLMTPSLFAKTVQTELSGLSKLRRSSSATDVTGDVLQVIVREREWVQEQKMGCFLAVAKGSAEPLKFLEVHYNPFLANTKEQAPATSPSRPVVLVGKGITFDSGGISIKPADGMGLMRGDMGGAATVVGAVYASAALGVRQHVIALTPLCENMPSGSAVKPGDVVVARNGKSIEVDNTDAEGRLILADALSYAHTFNPATLINLATLTGAIRVALGTAATGAFTTSDSLWAQVEAAGWATDERVWRMPLFPAYKKQIKSDYADLKNTGGRLAGACTAATFLKEFVEVDPHRPVRWMHLDIAGVSQVDEANGYRPKGMTGEPMRLLVEFLRRTEY